MNDEKTSPDNLTPENTEAAPKAKKKSLEDILLDILLLFLAWGVPFTVWGIMCGSIAVFASHYTYRWAAILIGLLVGTIVIGLVLSGDSPELEKSCCSVMLLVVGFLLLSTIRAFRHRAIQNQRSHTQQERKQQG